MLNIEFYVCNPKLSIHYFTPKDFRSFPVRRCITSLLNFYSIAQFFFFAGTPELLIVKYLF